MRSLRRFLWPAVIVVVCAAAAVAVLATRARPAAGSPAVQRAQAALEALRTAYYDPTVGLLATNAAPNGQSYGVAAGGTLLNLPSFKSTDMWDYSWALAAVEDVAQLQGGSAYLPLVRTLTDHLSEYWDAGAPVPGYAPTTHPGPNANKYFDDNAWAGLDLIAAYHLTHDAAYLAQAEAVFRYEESGWDTAGGGGMWWDDAHFERNTAANAPVAELAAYLYMATHQATYLTWSEKIYSWEVANLVDPVTGAVWDNIQGTKVSHRLWTYNQGDVIGAATLLYEITHQPAYLAQAKKTAGYALGMVQVGSILLAQPSFNGVLADNLQLLYQVSPNPQIVTLIDANAQSAWSNARNSSGLFAQNWGGPPTANSTIDLLTQTGAVRLFAVAAALEHGGFGHLWL